MEIFLNASFSDLNLDEDGSVEYGVRQCQEMAKILTRLVNDG